MNKISSYCWPAAGLSQLDSAEGDSSETVNYRFVQTADRKILLPALCVFHSFVCLLKRLNGKCERFLVIIVKAFAFYHLHLGLHHRRSIPASGGLKERLGAWKRAFIFLQGDA